MFDLAKNNIPSSAGTRRGASVLPGPRISREMTLLFGFSPNSIRMLFFAISQGPARAQRFLLFGGDGIDAGLAQLQQPVELTLVERRLFSSPLYLDECAR